MQSGPHLICRCSYTRISRRQRTSFMRKTCTIVKRSADSQTPPALESNDHFTVVQAEGARDSARNGGGSSPTYRASLPRARCRYVCTCGGAGALGSEWRPGGRTGQQTT